MAATSEPHVVDGRTSPKASHHLSPAGRRVRVRVRARLIKPPVVCKCCRHYNQQAQPSAPLVPSVERGDRLPASDSPQRGLGPLRLAPADARREAEDVSQSRLSRRFGKGRYSYRKRGGTSRLSFISELTARSPPSFASLQRYSGTSEVFPLGGGEADKLAFRGHRGVRTGNDR